MAPANPKGGAGKPKRKRQRKRRRDATPDFLASDSSSDEGSDDSDASGAKKAVNGNGKVKSPSPAPSSSSASSSDTSDEESSEDERPTKASLKGKGRAIEPEAPARVIKRPYPSRSPSPELPSEPIGSATFPFLPPLADGPILQNLPQDGAGAAETADADKQKQEAEFGKWWRARLVKEFEGELGGLASEPGLTSTRLSLLLSSLSSLSGIAKS